MKSQAKVNTRVTAFKLSTTAFLTAAILAGFSHSAQAQNSHKLVPVSGFPIACTRDADRCKFQMVRSPAVVKNQAFPKCGISANGYSATGRVKIKSEGTVEEMEVTVDNLPPKTNFDFFVIQVPNGPFGMSWYQGDMETDDYGHASEKFVGRFNEETFIVAPGSVPAPFVHNNAPHPDATVNPATGPIHTFHLGLWFNSPVDAGKAGCPTTVTPFNGEHNAGIQILNTSTFPDNKGPLFFVKP
jgi:hypothetical protein